MPKTYCPSCDAPIAVGTRRLGDNVVCRKCDMKLEVISTDPFDVDFPPDYYDDWHDREQEEEEFEQLWAGPLQSLERANRTGKAARGRNW